MSKGKYTKSSQGVTLSTRALVIALAVVLLLVAGGVTIGLNWNRWFGSKAPVGSARSWTPTQRRGPAKPCRISRKRRKPWA